MTLIIVLACIAGYLYVAWRTCLAFAARETEHYIQEYSHSATDVRKIDEWRRQNVGFGVLIGLVWPFYWAGRALTAHASAVMPRSTREQEIERRQREQRIAQIERELGIGQ